MRVKEILFWIWEKWGLCSPDIIINNMQVCYINPDTEYHNTPKYKQKKKLEKNF